MNYVLILAAMLLAVGFVAGGLILVSLVAPKRPSKWKNSIYECGEVTIGPAWIPFNVGYYLFALLFVVFEVEAAFLYPWALVFRGFGVAGLVEVGIFVFILITGLVYAWRKGVLEWV